MTDWRTLMKGSSPAHYPQNPQNRSQQTDSEDCEDIERGVKDARHVWRELATATSGLESDDPRLTPVLSALAECQHAHEAGSSDAFAMAAARVRRLMAFAPGALVRWHGSQDHHLTVLGPAVIEDVHVSDGRVWVWVEWQGTGRWVAETIVSTIEAPR